MKVEFADDTTAIGEWMWVRVNRCDDKKRLVFGTLDNEPLNDYDGKIHRGSELAVSYPQNLRCADLLSHRTAPTIHNVNSFSE